MNFLGKYMQIKKRNAKIAQEGKDVKDMLPVPVAVFHRVYCILHFAGTDVDFL